MPEPIHWTNETRRLGDLIPWPRNPRQIREDQARRLKDSFEQFGQVETIAVGPSNEIYNGHQRLNVLMAQHGPDYTVEVRVASRVLTEKEREKLTVYLHKGAAGEWDWDTLAEWDMPDLLEWGFKEYELGLVGPANDPNAEWKGMPEFEQVDKLGIKALIVHFETPEAIDNFAELVEQKIGPGTKYIWYPKQEPRKLKELVYHDES